jgi:putative hydrolase of HD superfamily
MVDKQDASAYVSFIFELGHLRRIKHEGWRIVGVDDPDSVAEHSLRAAQIAFVLASMEGKDPYKVCAMAVFHDMGECRIGDLHKIAARYVEADEERVVKDQTISLGETGKDIFDMWNQIDNRLTPEGIIAKDADYLEQAFLAREYVEKGYRHAQEWINNVRDALQTESAKKLIDELECCGYNDWWAHLKKVPKKYQ